MKPESTPVQAPTFQISRADLYVLDLTAVHTTGTTFDELSPERALAYLSSRLFQSGPDSDIDELLPPSSIGLHRQVIAEGYVGNEADQPDAVTTFLDVRATRRFIVEVVRDQTWWDRRISRHKILYSCIFGEPAPIPRKA